MDQESVRAFARRVSSGELGPEIQVRYHVAGGMPSQRLELDVSVNSESGALVSRYDASISEETARASIPSNALDVRGLLQAVGRGLHSLTPVSESMTFLPDSLVGRLTIVVDGHEEEFYFVPESEKRSEETLVSPAMDVALEQLWGLAMAPNHGTGGDGRA